MRLPILTLLAALLLSSAGLSPGEVACAAEKDSKPAESEADSARKSAIEHYAATMSEDGQISVVSPQEIELKEGSAMLEAKDDIKVVTGGFTTTLKKGALAIFRLEGRMARCFVLLGTATCHAGDKVHTAPTAGTEVVLCDHEPDQHEILYRDELGRRNLKVHKVHDQLFLVTTEFSLAQALEREPLVATVVHSQDPHDRILRNKLIKMAAVLHMVTGYRGQYMTGR